MLLLYLRYVGTYGPMSIYLPYIEEPGLELPIFTRTRTRLADVVWWVVVS